VVWTVLYLMMGLALYRVRRTDHPEQQTGIELFAAQLLVNTAWTPLFFRLQWFGFALLWLLMLLWLAARTALTFGRIDKTAGLLLAPYLLWLTFAAYLNWGVSLLN
jgi:tryptophan-rich sensory protein